MGINRNEFEFEFKMARPRVLERDGSRCVKCGLTLELEVHHIEGYKCNDLDKLATLCCFCHGIAPMGKKEFDQWMVFGKDGVDSIRERLAKNGMGNMKREQVIIFCKTLVELKFDTSKGKLKAARERMKANGFRCEGRKPYGSKPGEDAVVEKMKELYARGKSPNVIARELNITGIPTRGTIKGKSPWHQNTIHKILTREGLIKTTSRPKKISSHIPQSQKISENDHAFWLEVDHELKRGRLPKPKNDRAKYTLDDTDKRGAWIPVMMHGAELRQVENIEKTS